MIETFSVQVARRIALAASGFADSRPAVPTRRHLARVLSRIRLLQLDSVNVAIRAHYMPLYSRLGSYPLELLDNAAWTSSARQPRMLVEYWAHEASLIPIEHWPLLGWRMRRHAESPGRYWQSALAEHGLVEDVLTAVKELGPIGAGALERELGVARRRAKGSWWNRSEVKRTCEYLFAVGELTTGARRGFERLYDLTERVLPAQARDMRVNEPDAIRELVRLSGSALGIATEADLRDYYRLPPQESRQAVSELVEEGTLVPVEVRGWRARAYRYSGARVPRRITARALLCPFDPLVWRRERAQLLFDFTYRIEIYVPGHQRVHGYYVFPFLLNDALVARVDLKADRAKGLLLVHGAFIEPTADVAQVASELAAELSLMAGWLGLAGVAVGKRGDLASALRDILPWPSGEALS